MTLRDSQQTGRLRLRHLMENTEARGDDMAAESARFRRLADPASAPRAVSSFNLFQTPEPLARRVAELANLAGASRILEPSAGLGRLYRAARAVSVADIVLAEIAADCCRELYRETEGDDGATLVQADFLACDAGRLGTFDRVLMNPPFKNGVDRLHIGRALELLQTGGRLVSLCAAGPRQRSFAERIGATWHDLPAGSFASEGTHVAAAIIIVDK